MRQRAILLIVTIIIVPFGVSSLRGGDDAVDGRHVQQGVQRLCNEVFDNCIMVFQLDATFHRNGTVVGRNAGQLTFARTGSCAFSDTAVIESHTVSGKEGHARDNTRTYVQFFMANGRRCISTHYEPTKKEPRVRGVTCNPNQSYEEGFLALTSHVHLENVLSEFGPTGTTLIELTRPTPGSVRRTQGANLIAIYPTVYGPLEVTLDRTSGTDLVRSIRMAQSPSDVYTSRFNGGTLSQVPDSIVGETPGGLTAVVTDCIVNYEGLANRQPLSSIVIKLRYAAVGKEWRGMYTLRLKEYRKCTSEKEIESLRIPIPEGELVHSLDPEYRSLALAYREGQVVREVDGASLEEVAAEKRFHRTALYVAAPILVVLFLAAIAVWYFRRSTRHSMP